LYKKITDHAFENLINVKSKYSKFPQSEKALSNQIVRVQSTFRNSGYEITSKRNFSRNSKYERGTRIFRIKFIGTNNTNHTSTSLFDYNSKDISPVSVVPVCQEPKQAQNHSKTDTISEYRDCASVSGENITYQTKNNQENTIDTVLTQKNKKELCQKKSESVPKNTTDTVAQLTQLNPCIEQKSQKTKVKQKEGTNIVKNLQDLEINDTKKPKIKSYNKKKKSTKSFNCKTCNFGNFINMDSKSRISDKTLYDIHIEKNPKHKLKFSDEVIP